MSMTTASTVATTRTTSTTAALATAVTRSTHLQSMFIRRSSSSIDAHPTEIWFELQARWRSQYLQLSATTFNKRRSQYSAPATARSNSPPTTTPATARAATLSPGALRHNDGRPGPHQAYHRDRLARVADGATHASPSNANDDAAAASPHDTVADHELAIAIAVTNAL